MGKLLIWLIGFVDNLEIKEGTISTVETYMAWFPLRGEIFGVLNRRTLLEIVSMFLFSTKLASRPISIIKYMLTYNCLYNYHVINSFSNEGILKSTMSTKKLNIYYSYPLSILFVNANCTWACFFSIYFLRTIKHIGMLEIYVNYYYNILLYDLE